jgi:hypothetical protein
MIGTKYTPGLLAELAKTPHLRSMEIPATPNGQRVFSFTKRYTDGWECKTTLFNADDAELVSTMVDCGADGSRFGFTLDHYVDKVTAFLNPEGRSLSFVVRRWFEEGSDERSVVLSAAASVEVRLDDQSVIISPNASVEIRSEANAVSVIEETHSGADKITSFFEDETSDDPWMVIVEPN